MWACHSETNVGLPLWNLCGPAILEPMWTCQSGAQCVASKVEIKQSHTKCTQKDHTMVPRGVRVDMEHPFIPDPLLRMQCLTWKIMELDSGIVVLWSVNTANSHTHKIWPSGQSPPFPEASVRTSLWTHLQNHCCWKSTSFLDQRRTVH